MIDLLALAERVVPGHEATAILDEVRATLEDEYGRALIYEVVPPTDGSDWLEPRAQLLSNYLDSRKYGPIGGPSVRIAIWVGPSMHLLTSEAFFGYVAEKRGVTLKVLEQELRAARRAADAN